jgi:cell division protein FtsQ
VSAQVRELPSNRRIATPPRAVTQADPPKADWDPGALGRTLKKIGRIVLAIAIVVLGVGAAIAARRHVTKSPRFALANLRVDGARHRSEGQIAAAAGVAIGQNVVDLDLEAARARLETDPWIERATLGRQLPATISIEVVEREAAAIVALGSGSWLSTPRGELFKRVEESDPNDLPVVTGISDVDAVSDREATAEIVRRALDLAADVERAGIFGGRIHELHVDADGSLTAAVGRRAVPGSPIRTVRLAFGRGGYRAKVKLAARIEGELARRSARATVVFLDDDDHPERVVVRLVAALPPATVTVDDGPAASVKNGGPP